MNDSADKSRSSLPPAAQRALAEAEARRAKEAQEKKKAGEKGGPAGPEPTRYGDWERKGRAVDF
ncbi:MAG: succinate dehydrogenase assembly factor 4 [Pseudomonadota bacterium]